LAREAVTIFAPDRLVQDVKECYFYHSMDIPGYGAVTGEWDLRHRMSDYLGNISFDGKRVLEMGTADGFACFYMESQGAEVVAFDLSGAETWDVVPFARDNSKIFNVERKHHIERLNNAFWLSHRAFRSKSRMVYGNAYSIPAEIGDVDIATFGSILLHLRDPFLALHQALRLTRETVVVTDLAEPLGVPAVVRRWRQNLPKNLGRPAMKFLPDWKVSRPQETWWQLSPELIKSFIGVLGFEQTRVTYHSHDYYGGKRKAKIKLFTVVGHRTQPRSPRSPSA